MFVTDIIQETKTIKRFRLCPVNGEPLPVFSGGSHITTYLRNDDRIIERHYSLVSDPTERHYYEIAIRRDDASRGGSVFWHDQVKAGDRVEITFPKNHFPVSFQARHHVFYAAGIGITPFMTMMADLAKEGKSFELHYAARSKELCAFYDVLQEKYGDHCTFYFSSDENARRMAPETMQDHPIGTHVYFCGPNSMVKQFSEAAASYGYPAKNIHFELFSPPDTGKQVPFRVTLSKSQEIEVSANETLLEALLNAGIKAPYSCRAGGCGQCEVEVLEGEVDHRDMFFSDEERIGRKFILTCVSRAKSDCLVLHI